MNLKSQLSCFRCVFVYDRAFSQSEEDDPGDSIVYFYPSDVSEDARIALCGQLMGVAQFLMTSLYAPKVFSLAHDKFGVVNIGTYTLGVGFAEETADYILERELECLIQLMKFYQGELYSQLWVKPSTAPDFRKQVCEALEMLVRLAHNKWSDLMSCTFHHLPTVELPRSASSLFLRSQQVLNAGQQNKGVIGGAMFYKMRVVSSQLNPLLTYWISFLNPSNSQFDGVSLDVCFHPPVGVNLVRIHVNSCKSKKRNDVPSHNSVKRSVSCFFNSHTDIGKMSEKSRRRLSDITQHFRAIEEKQLKRSRSVDDLLLNAVSFRGFGMGVGLPGLARYLARSAAELHKYKAPETLGNGPIKDPESGFDEETDSELQERAVEYAQLPCSDVQEMGLYVHAHQHMTLVFLLEKQAYQDPQTIHSLWQLGMYSLADLQTGIVNVEEQCSAGENTCAYHFLAFDPLWMGLTGGGGLQSKVSYLQDIREAHENHRYLQELTVRHEDELSYTQSVGRKQIYYQQGVKKERAGLPSPMDSIGRVFTRIKTTLEKDHNVTLF